MLIFSHLEGYNPNDLVQKTFDVLITSSFNCLSERKKKDRNINELSNLIRNAKKKNGNLLILSNSLSRFMEIILLIEEVIFKNNKPLKTRLIIFDSMK